MSVDINTLQLTKQEIERFWSHVDIGNEDECWEWQRYHTWSGYGQINIRGTVYVAPRIAWLITYGKFPANFACHKCDNTSYCNPSHLFDGTQEDNIRDAISKSRMRHGRHHYNSTLNDAKVRAIRDLFATGKWTQDQLAKEYGVNRAAISKVVLRTTWKHVQ